MGHLSWLDELPLEVGASVHAMGTRALDPQRWLQPHGGDGELLALKRDLLSSHRSDVSGELPRFARAAERASEAIAAQIGAGAEARGDLESLALGTAEDLCVVARSGDRWLLVAGVVCFPSMWRLPDKLGMSMADVHGPVPRYAHELEERVDRFLERLREGRPVWRRNWFVHDVPDLFLPGPVEHHARVDPPHGLWLRSERQTLARVASDVIVFSIRTQQTALEVVAGRPAIALRMRDAVASWPPDIVEYRGATSWRDDLVAWLTSAGEDR